MEQVVGDQMRLARLMRDDIRQDLEKMRSLSSSLVALNFNLERRIQSHFDSKLELDERSKQLEATAAKIEKEKTEAERRLHAEFELKERELREANQGLYEGFCRAKEDNAKLSKTLQEKEELINVMKKNLDELEAQMQEEEKKFQLKEKELREEHKRLSGQLLDKEKKIYSKRKGYRDMWRSLKKNELNLKDKELGETKKTPERRCAEVNEKEMQLSVRRQVDEGYEESTKKILDLFQSLENDNMVLRESIQSLTQQLEQREAEVKRQPPSEDELRSTIQQFLELLTSSGIIAICNKNQSSGNAGESSSVQVDAAVPSEGSGPCQTTGVQTEGTAVHRQGPVSLNGMSKRQRRAMRRRAASLTPTNGAGGGESPKIAAGLNPANGTAGKTPKKRKRDLQKTDFPLGTRQEAPSVECLHHCPPVPSMSSTPARSSHGVPLPAGRQYNNMAPSAPPLFGSHPHPHPDPGSWQYQSPEMPPHFNKLRH